MGSFATLAADAAIRSGEAAQAAFPELWNFAFMHRPAIDRAIERALPAAPAGIKTSFNEAVHRAIFPGGKRIRPVITLLGAELFGGTTENALPAAAAAEFIHTSSLIFDDLPSMDDSAERRGEVSLHKRYGEGLATLVALSFLNAAYQIGAVNHDSETSRRAVHEMVDCIGPGGMIGGQVLDLAVLDEPQSYSSSPETRSLRNLKTAALMRLSLKLGAISARIDEEKLACLDNFANLLGEAYQFSDDLLDLEEDAKRSDLPGVVTEFQEHSLRRHLTESITSAKLLLAANFPESRARLCLEQLSEYIEERAK